MKRKILVCLLAFFMAFGYMNGAPCAAANQSFPDVGNHWAKDYIKQLTGLGYMAGYPNGTFQPDKIMTRAEFTTALVSCMGITHNDKLSSYFRDTSGSWAIASINAAVDSGILIPDEYSTGLGPDGGIKRSEACAMLVRALGKSAGTGLPSFSDSAKIKTSMYAGYIKTACDLGLMSGYPDGSFQPFTEMSRAQACTVLYKLLAQQGKVPANPASISTSPASPTGTSTTGTASTGSIKSVAMGSDTYDISTTPISFIVNYQEAPVSSLVAANGSLVVNNTYTFTLNNSDDNPDVVINNNRYGVSSLALNGDQLVITPTYRKVYKFTVGDYSYNSDYVSLYVNSANKGLYLSDMGIIDEDHVNIDGQNYDLGTDKITIGVKSSGSSTVDFYDIEKIDLTQGADMQLSATDPVVMNQLSMSDISAIFADNSTLDLNSISNIYFIMGGKRYSLAGVTIDATGHFSAGSKVYPYSQVTMIIDDLQYTINSLQIVKSKFVFYCNEGSTMEWVIVNNQYRDASDVSIIKGSTTYSLDEAVVVKRNVIRINGSQYTVDSDFKCQVDDKTYYIDEISYDSSKQAIVIETGDEV